MRVLIFEPDSDGHRLHHVRNILQAVRECSQDVTVALSADAASRPEFAVHLKDVAEQAQIDAWMPPLPRGRFKGATHRADMLRQSIQRAKADWVYVPYGDALSQVLGARRKLMLPDALCGVPGETLILRGRFAYPTGNFRESLSAKLSWSLGSAAPWKVMHILDPLVFEQLPKSARLRLMPDPVEVPPSTDRTAARARLGIPTDGRYIGCVGLIDSRKGVDRLIRAFDAAGLGATDRILLAGRHAAEIRQLLTGPCAHLVQQGRVISFDRTVSTDQMLDALVASDLVAALYPDHIGSASIAIRAAAAQRPVLAHPFGWLGAMVPRFDLGWLCDVTNESALSAALRDALDRSAAFQPTEAGRRFVEFHSIENFRAHWTAELRNHLRLPVSPHHRTWEWTTDRQ